MAEQAELTVIPPEWVSHDGSYTIEAYIQPKPFVVIEHNVEIKVPMTEMFRDNGHTVLQTDFNYTGMIWENQNLMSILNIVDNPDVHFVFIAFKMERWAYNLPSAYFQYNAFYHNALYFNNYLNAALASFKYQELFGHLDFRCLRVGIDVRRFQDEATQQIAKIKRDICWALQFEANKNKLNWNVNLNTENCDIALVITVSKKCYMHGIQIKRPQPQIEGMPRGECIQMFWPFLQAAESVRVLNFHQGGGWYCICTLQFGEAVAAFLHVLRRRRDGSIETVSWVPLQWDRFAIAQLTARNAGGEPSTRTHTNIEMTRQVLLVRSFIHKMLCQQHGENLDTYQPRWIT